jgi:uncharacterized membrane protein
MSQRAVITVLRGREELQRLWAASPYRPSNVDESEATVTFRDAPGDRGTEICVELKQRAPAGKLGEMVQKIAGTEPLARVKDDLRRFKQHVETGEIARSDGTPEGEDVGRKLRQRPAQPTGKPERERAGV